MIINPIKGYIVSESKSELVVSEPIYMTDSEINYADQQIDSYYNVTNIQQLHNYSLTHQRLTNIMRKNINYAINNNFDRLSRDYYLYEIHDSETNHSQIGILASLSVAELKSNPSLIVENEGHMEDNVNNKVAELLGANLSISPLYLMKDTNSTSTKIASLFDVGEWKVLRSINRGRFTHTIYKNLKNDLEFVSFRDRILGEISELHIADGHHRYNAYLKSDMDNMMVVIFDSEDCRVEGYHRILRTNRFDFNNIVNNLFNLKERLDVLPEVIDSPIICSKNQDGISMYKLDINSETVSDLYREVDHQIIPSIEAHSSKKFTFSSDKLELANCSYGVQILLPPIPISEIISDKNLPAKSTYFYPKPLNGLVVAV